MIVIVFGVGRSGTSTVARILHEKLGVHMGYSWVREANPHNPLGFYECQEFGNALCYTTEATPHHNMVEWFQRLIRWRMKHHTKWGVKANTLCYCLTTFVRQLPEKPVIINCARPFGQVVDSWVRSFADMSFKEAAFEVMLRQMAIDRYRQEHHIHDIEFNDYPRKSDAQVQEEIEACLTS